MEPGVLVSTRRLLRVYSLWMVALVLLYFVFPHQKLVFWTAIGFSAMLDVSTT